MKLKHDMDVLEIVGTGGDGSNSFNISTTASLVIAAGLRGTVKLDATAGL